MVNVRRNYIIAYIQKDLLVTTDCNKTASIRGSDTEDKDKTLR